MAQRRSLPKSAYAVPEKAPGPGSYPEPDKAHARAALREIGHAGANAGRVRAKARAVLGKPKMASTLGNKGK